MITLQWTWYQDKLKHDYIRQMLCPRRPGNVITNAWDLSKNSKNPAFAHPNLCPGSYQIPGFLPGGVWGGPDPLRQHYRGGYPLPPCWSEKLKYFPYFTVISVKMGHFKHPNFKTLLSSYWGRTPRPPRPFWTPPLKHLCRKPWIP